MRIGLLDADLLDGGTRFPNLALMKVSSFQRSAGNETTLVRDFATASECDKIFVSKVFTKSQTPSWLDLIRDRCEFGGTGFNLYDAAPLPDVVERSRPDYDLYAPFVASLAKRPSWADYYDKASLGFTTRGCVRRRPFCVNRDKTAVVGWSPVSEFLEPSRPRIILLDDNVFAYRGWRSIFDDLESTGKRFCYKQGLDIRLTTNEKAAALERAKYFGDVIFAFDDVRDERAFRRGAATFRDARGKPAKAYLLCGFYRAGIDELRDVFRRIAVLDEYRILPYLMRHDNYLNDAFAAIYVDLARWCNQPSFFKSASFWEFATTNGSKKTRELLTRKELKDLVPIFQTRFFTRKTNEPNLPPRPKNRLARFVIRRALVVLRRTSDARRVDELRANYGALRSIRRSADRAESPRAF